MCSASCGGGSRTRTIFCTEENGNETTKVKNRGRNKDNLNISFISNSGILSVPFFVFSVKQVYSFRPSGAGRIDQILFSSYSRKPRDEEIYFREISTSRPRDLWLERIYTEDRIEARRDNDNVIENSTHFISGISFHRIESFILRAV